MKIIKYLSLILAVTLMAVSAKKYAIEIRCYNPLGMWPEIQLHYIVPVTAVAANNITKVEINNQLYSNTKAPLNTYNAIPNGTRRRNSISPTRGNC
ncbi:MAG: hypothetical protein U5L72_16310 [Bacteroidales bacterium]|nr:hypothetical protein [Bacteroidales bacterium]